MQKQLQQLIDLLPEANVIGGANKTITDITADSRIVQPGSLFIALKGVHVFLKGSRCCRLRMSARRWKSLRRSFLIIQVKPCA